MTAEEFKAQGNKAFSSGQYDEAIAFFTKAIELDNSNHVLYSNRSAAYASKKEYKLALDDAENTTKIKPDWAKGYSRKGAALHGLGQLDDAVKAYKKATEIDPNNAVFKKGLEDVERQMQSDVPAALGNMFGADMWSKMASNPKLSPYLAQPDVVEMLKECQADPKNMSKYMQDQRMMQIMLSLMGLDGQLATNDEELEKAKEKANSDLENRQYQKEAATPKEPEPEVSDDEKQKIQKRKASDDLKTKGNENYKKRQFDEALSFYDQAWEADSTNVAVLTNKAAVLFEMEKYEETIKICLEAVDSGREIRADFKLIGRALGRIGSSYQKLDDIENAIKYFGKSLAENRTAEILTKLRDCEKLKKDREIAAYISPEKSVEEREKGNVHFKANQYPEAVKCYTEAIKRNPEDPKNFSNRAAAYTKLMALPEAEKDCDKAIALDENFVKAYIRKAAVQFGKREFSKSIETCQLALTKDTEGKHANEIQGQINKAYGAMGQGANSAESREQAMKNPEVQQILGDPVMQQILQQMQQDPAAAREHLKNPAFAKKFQVLVDAGIIGLGK